MYIKVYIFCLREGQDCIYEDLGLKSWGFERDPQE